MFRGNLKKLSMGAVVAIAACGADAPRADAFWWGHSSGGSYGSWGSYGGSYGSYGSWGGWRHRRQWRQAYYQSSGGSYGSWGSSGGSYGSYGSHGGAYVSSYGSWGSSGGSSGWTMMRVEPAAPLPVAPEHPMPVEPGVEADGPPVPPSDAVPEIEAPEGEAAPEPADGETTRWGPLPHRAILNVHVPAEAKVYVNGMATTSTGVERRYVSNGLLPGFRYTYQLRAQVTRDGQSVTETKVVKLQAGESTSVEFAFEGSGEPDRLASEPVRTRLILHVPAEAKVYLSGNETGSFGPVREFSTTKLVAGDRWDEYVVRVEVEREGRVLTKEETVSLQAGDSREITFDFDAPQVARAGADRD